VFAVGVMNLIGVAVLAVFILTERVGYGSVVARVGGAAMVGFGVLLIAVGFR
jgi:predicted metal-binding membrane protein